MNKIKIKEAMAENGKAIIKIYTPYNADFVPRLKALKAKWDGDGKCWAAPALLIDAVRDALRDCYAYTDLDDVQYIALRVKIHTTYSSDYYEPLVMYGKTIAKASGRDSGARYDNDVAYISGQPDSGGSRKNWYAVVREGAELILQDVAQPLYERDKHRYDEYAEINVIKQDEPEPPIPESVADNNDTPLQSNIVAEYIKQYMVGYLGSATTKSLPPNITTADVWAKWLQKGRVHTLDWLSNHPEAKIIGEPYETDTGQPLMLITSYVECGKTMCGCLFTQIRRTVRRREETAALKKIWLNELIQLYNANSPDDPILYTSQVMQGLDNASAKASHIANALQPPPPRPIQPTACQPRIHNERGAGRKPLAPEIVAKIKSCLAEGKSIRVTAGLCKVSTATVQKYK